MKTKQVFCLVVVLASGLSAVGTKSTSSFAQTPSAESNGQTTESALFKGLLKSLSLRKRDSTDTGLQKKTPAASQPPVGRPQSTPNDKNASQVPVPARSPGTQANSAVGLPIAGNPSLPSPLRPGMPGPASVCNHCGSAIVAGACTGGKAGMPCQNPGSGSGSSGPAGSKGKAAKGQGNNTAGSAAASGDGTSNFAGNQNDRSSSQPNSAPGVNGSRGGRNGGSMPPTPSSGNDPMANAQAIATRAAANLAASQAGGTSGNAQGSILGGLSDLIDSVHAGAAVGPGLRWKVVKPAGVGDRSNAPAINMDPGETELRGDGQKAFQLDPGIVRSDLLTGPSNPLLIPPDIASVVYVIDCSTSMEGERFAKVARGVIDAVSQMSDQQQFAVLLFNTVAMQIDGGGLIPATAANRQVLATQLSQVLPVGGTNPTDALLIALQMKPETMVVFSDGEFDESIVQRITSLNRSAAKRIQINCVGIEATVSVLRELASMNGPGNYIEVP